MDTIVAVLLSTERRVGRPTRPHPPQALVRLLPSREAERQVEERLAQQPSGRLLAKQAREHRARRVPLGAVGCVLELSRKHSVELGSGRRRRGRRVREQPKVGPRVVFHRRQQQRDELVRRGAGRQPRPEETVREEAGRVGRHRPSGREPSPVFRVRGVELRLGLGAVRAGGAIRLPVDGDQRAAGQRDEVRREGGQRRVEPREEAQVEHLQRWAAVEQQQPAVPEAFAREGAHAQ
mmetsp:Transcript_25801/g.83066  ORF Transcript_25801/g.83066 Transcript_25801/m.83066 type:complete len:236 (-) Transcript_25801:286-993(-)